MTKLATWAHEERFRGGWPQRGASPRTSADGACSTKRQQRGAASCACPDLPTKPTTGSWGIEEPSEAARGFWPSTFWTGTDLAVRMCQQTGFGAKESRRLVASAYDMLQGSLQQGGVVRMHVDMRILYAIGDLAGISRDALASVLRVVGPRASIDVAGNSILAYSLMRGAVTPVRSDLSTVSPDSQQDPGDSPGFHPEGKPVKNRDALCEGQPDPRSVRSKNWAGFWICKDVGCVTASRGGMCRVFPEGDAFYCACTPPGWQRPRDQPQEVPDIPYYPVPELPAPKPDPGRPQPGEPRPRPWEPTPAPDWIPILTAALIVATIITLIVLWKFAWIVFA